MASPKSKKANAQRNLTRQKKLERAQTAQRQAERAKAREEAAQRTKKIFTVVVCVILVLALGIPTMSLAFLSA